MTGKVCHIKARAEGGPRYEPNQSDKERHVFENLVLMCARHSMVIDSEAERYSVEVLRKIKAEHEQIGRGKLSEPDPVKADALFAGYRSMHIRLKVMLWLIALGFQAANVTLKTTKAKLKFAPPRAVWAQMQSGETMLTCTF